MARPGVKRSGTSCAVDNTQNKAGLGAGAAPGPDGRPERAPRGLGAVPGSGRGGGTVEGPALPPAASWGFHKYLLNKETTALAFPVIVALAPPPPPGVWAGEAPGPRWPSSPPPHRPVPDGQTSPRVGARAGLRGAPGALQRGTQAPPLPQGPKLTCHTDQEFLLCGHLGTCLQGDCRGPVQEGGWGGLQAGPGGKGAGPGGGRGPDARGQQWEAGSGSGGRCCPGVKN